MNPQTLPFKQFKRILIIFDTDEKSLRDFKKMFLPATVLASNGEMKQFFNPQWTPTWYVIKKGAVIDQQQEPSDATYNL